MTTTFEYRARDASGTACSGVLSADSSRAAARDLSERGWVTLQIQPQRGARVAAAVSPAATPPASPTTPARAKGKPGGNKRSLESMGFVMRELSALLRAGVPLMRALHLVCDSTADAPVRDALQHITRDLDQGHNLITAAEHEHRRSGLFTAYDVAMLQVGEQTGRLSETFADLHRHRDFTRATREQVVAALRYPAFVLLTCVAAMVVVSLFVLPSFAKVFAQARAELPVLTLFLMASSRFMVAYWPLLLAGCVAGAWGWRHWVATTGGGLWWDKNKLRLPIIGRIVEGILLTRLTASFSSAVSAGLTVTDSLMVTGRTLENAWYEQRLVHMCSELARGVSITAAARSMGVLPPTLLQLFAIGEESGSLEVLMREMSLHYQTEVDSAIKRLSATLEPVLIWFLGMGVLVLALGVFMPMWDLGRASLR